MSDVTVTRVPASSGIDVSKRLLPNEAFKVVLGDDVYRQPWVAEDRSIVLVNGRPVDKRWNQLYPETGRHFYGVSVVHVRHSLRGEHSGPDRGPTVRAHTQNAKEDPQRSGYELD